MQFAFFLIENRFNVISEGAIHCQKNETHPLIRNTVRCQKNKQRNTTLSICIDLSQLCYLVLSQKSLSKCLKSLGLFIMRKDKLGKDLLGPLIKHFLVRTTQIRIFPK